MFLDQVLTQIAMFFLTTTCCGCRTPQYVVYPPTAIEVRPVDLFGARRSEPIHYTVPESDTESWVYDSGEE